MKLIFFGTAGAVQSGDNANVCFSVVDEDISILVDASGNPVQYLKKTGINPLSFDTLVLTHSHTDHLYALPSLIHNLWMMQRQKPLRIISNMYTKMKAEELCTVLSLLSKEGLFPINWTTANDKEINLLAEVKIKVFPVEHSAPTCGVRISTASSSLVYSSDTAPSHRVIREAEGAKALIHEASGDSSSEEKLNRAGHSSGRQAGETAEKAGVELLFLCHFDLKEGSFPEQAAQEAKKAFSGKIIVPDLFRVYEV